MDKRDKLYQLHQIISQSSTAITKAYLLEKLECSESTLKRRINDLRHIYGAPLIYDKQRHGWYYQKDTRFELPGLWFNDQELYALLTLEQLLENLDKGLVSEQLLIAKDRIKAILSTKLNKTQNIHDKLRLISIFHRTFKLSTFEEIAKATFDARKIEITHINRQTQERTQRIVSPQRLVHYKDTWYIDAYCHHKQAMRTFAIDAITAIKHHHTQAKIIPPADIDKLVQSSYGIFSGKAHQQAVLHFKPPASFWIAKEKWHPKQQTQWLDNNILQLTIPYHHDKELLADILRYAETVEVISPISLQQKIQQIAHTILSHHA